MLPVHPVSGEIVRFDRLKGAGPDMKRHEGMRDGRKDLRCEVESRRGRSDRAGIVRVDRLVAFAVLRVGGAVEVGGDWHLTMPLQIGGGGEGQ